MSKTYRLGKALFKKEGKHFVAERGGDYELRFREDDLIFLGATLLEDPQPIEELKIDESKWNSDVLEDKRKINELVRAVNTLRANKGDE